ncbi:MAG: hypothetical protein AAGK77_11840 [Pseudomonadota bacterium]
MKIERRAERIKDALEPLVTELLAAGVRLNANRSMHFLHAEDYPIGLPIILSHLERRYDDLPKSVIAGALSYTKNTHTRAIWPEIAELYAKTPNEAKPFEEGSDQHWSSATKRTLANALVRLYEPKRLATLMELVRNKAHGETRIILLGPLIRVCDRREGMRAMLADLKADPELETELTARGI